MPTMRVIVVPALIEEPSRPRPCQKGSPEVGLDPSPCSLQAAMVDGRFKGRTAVIQRRAGRAILARCGRPACACPRLTPVDGMWLNHLRQPVRGFADRVSPFAAKRRGGPSVADKGGAG